MRVLCSAAVVAASYGFAEAQSSIQYDFTLAVTENNIGLTDPGNVFVDVPIGAMGLLSIEASTAPFTDFGSDDTLSYSILATSGSVGGIDLMLDQSGFPSTSFLSGLTVSDDISSPSLGRNADILSAFVPSLRPDAATNLITIGAPGDGAAVPGLWDSPGLPTSIDVTLDGFRGVFTIGAPSFVNRDGRLFTEIVAVEVTVIPAPASAVLLACGLVARCRRR
ncbi:MAG: hypothetical protein AAFN41_07210 [Planctomycetota bacterium]